MPALETVTVGYSKWLTDLSDDLRNAQAYVKHVEDTESVFQF